MHIQSQTENSNQGGNDRKVCRKPTCNHQIQENIIGQIFIPPDCKCIKKIAFC